jgi:predicted secreted hydrolase
VKARLVVAIVALLAALAMAGDAGQWQQAGPDHAWSFPRDHYAHPGFKTEWWYVTGQLTAPNDRRLGYQFTLFRVGILPQPPSLDSAWSASDLVMGHVAITDLAAGTHTFSEILFRAAAGLGGFGAPDDSVVAWGRAPAGTPGRWEFRRRADDRFALVASDDRQGLALALDLAPLRPLVLQGPGGFSVKDPARDSGSLYYSYTRLATRGVVVSGGDTLRVTGTSWLDREFFSGDLAREQVGWDWFSLQLDDGRDLMLYRLREQGGDTSAASGTLVGASGDVVYLARGDWRLEPTRTWRSPQTGAEYPVAWRLAVPAAGLDVTIEARLDDQENVSRRTGDVVYWEGAVVVRSAQGNVPLGLGYAEMTGYGGHRLPM